MNKNLRLAMVRPWLVPRALLNRLKRVLNLWILRDPHTVHAKKWFRDNGDETLRLDYPLTSESIVMDLGGYKGDFAYDINQKYGCHVYLYEPVKEYYLECIERFKENEKIQCFNYGLSNENGSFLISDEDNGSSIIRRNTKGSLEKVVVKDIVAEFSELNLQCVDLMKINIEGPEFLILPHLISSGLIEKTIHIQVQFHDFYPGAGQLRNEIRRKLDSTHLEEWNYPFVWESWKRKSS